VFVDRRYFASRVKNTFLTSTALPSASLGSDGNGSAAGVTPNCLRTAFIPRPAALLARVRFCDQCEVL
jgi:hypothetical protein